MKKMIIIISILAVLLMVSTATAVPKTQSDSIELSDGDGWTE